MKKILTALSFLTSGLAYSQSAQLTPVVNIGTHTVGVYVPAKFENSFPAGKTLQVASKYTVSIFQAGGLTKPRFMAFSPAGVLHGSLVSYM
jgi:hypothetical protein